MASPRSARRGSRSIFGPMRAAERRQLLDVEAVDARGVAAEHRGELVLGKAVERLDHLLARVRPGAFRVRIVASPT